MTPPQPVSELVEAQAALQRLYVNVRAEYPFSVRDMEIVKDALSALAARAERLRISLNGERSGAKIDFARAEAAEAALAEAREALAEYLEIKHLTIPQLRERFGDEWTREVGRRSGRIEGPHIYEAAMENVERPRCRSFTRAQARTQ